MSSTLGSLFDAPHRLNRARQRSDAHAIHLILELAAFDCVGLGLDLGPVLTLTATGNAQFLPILSDCTTRYGQSVFG